MRQIFPPLLAALPGLAAAQASGTTLPETGAGLLQATLALGVVIAALVGGLWLLKKLTAPRGAASGALRIVAGTAVGARERVVVIEVGETWLVLGVAPGHVSALHQMPRGEPAHPASAPAGRDFGAWLKQVMERRNAD